MNKMGIAETIEKKKATIQEKTVKAAINDARHIASILVKKFGASEVILYGSLIGKKNFDSASDIDIAVKGLGDRYLKAYGYCLRNSKFNLDMKAYEDMPQKFRKVVDTKGVNLNG